MINIVSFLDHAADEDEACVLSSLEVSQSSLYYIAFVEILNFWSLAIVVRSAKW